MNANLKVFLIAIVAVIVVMSSLIMNDLQKKNDYAKSMAYALEQTEAFTMSELYTRHSYSENSLKQHERIIEQEQIKTSDSLQPVNIKHAEQKGNEGKERKQQQISDSGPVIEVLISEKQTIERVPIEQYVLGVALAELPGSFEYEAIKAQMLAIRTYIIRRANAAQNSDESSPYLVTDTTSDQVYLSLDKVKAYKADYPEQYEKFVKALQETEGMFISYENEPIDALFFSTSNGYTENADAVWGQEVAYLQSVESPWDEALSPNYKSEASYSFDELYELLNLKESRRNGNVKISNIARTKSGRIESLKVNGASFTGRELREKLALSSTDMTWTIDQRHESITFTCYGYGHGVGLSQWGANGMAKQGYLAEEIIMHYYTGVHINSASL